MLRQLHALVVDDEPHCRDYLCRQLERTCPSITVVQTAASAKEAERLIRDLAPDVVFMDIHMPHQSGLDLLDALSDRDFYLVFTTAFDEYAVEALRKQAFDYLLKPIQPQRLEAALQKVSRQRALVDPQRLSALLERALAREDETPRVTARAGKTATKPSGIATIDRGAASGTETRHAACP